MKSAVVLLLMIPANVALCQATSIIAPMDPPWKLGMGFQLSGSNLFLLSWQSPDQNHYGQSWRIEPMIGGSYSYNESSYPSISESVTLGLGVYRRWRVRAPFDDLYFLMGPRVTVSASRQSYQYQPYPDSLPLVTRSSQNLATSLGFLLGPEYEIDKWQQHFSIAGFIILTASIVGRAQESPNDWSPSSWSFNLVTGTGIVLRYYFR